MSDDTGHDETGEDGEEETGEDGEDAENGENGQSPGNPRNPGNHRNPGDFDTPGNLDIPEHLRDLENFEDGWATIRARRSEWHRTDDLVNRARTVGYELETLAEELRHGHAPGADLLERIADALDRFQDADPAAFAFLIETPEGSDRVPIEAFEAGQAVIPTGASAVVDAIESAVAAESWSGLEAAVEDVLEATDDPDEETLLSTYVVAECFDWIADAAVEYRNWLRDEIQADLDEAYGTLAAQATDPLSTLEEQPIALFPVAIETRFSYGDEGADADAGSEDGGSNSDAGSDGGGDGPDVSSLETSTATAGADAIDPVGSTFEAALGRDDPEELWIRVYPDEIHRNDHEPELTASEIEYGKRFWARLWLANHAETPVDGPTPATVAPSLEVGLDLEWAITFYEAGLEPSAWRRYEALELSPKTAYEYHLAGLDPERVEAYESAGVPREDVLAFHLTHRDPGTWKPFLSAGMDPSSLLESYLPAGLAPRELREYVGLGVSPPDALDRYHPMGLDPSTLAAYRDAGVSPNEAVAFHLVGLSPETLQEYVDAGLSAERAYEFHCSGLTPDGYRLYTNTVSGRNSRHFDAEWFHQCYLQGLSPIQVGTQWPRDGRNPLEVAEYLRVGLPPNGGNLAAGEDSGIGGFDPNDPIGGPGSRGPDPLEELLAGRWSLDADQTYQVTDRGMDVEEMSAFQSLGVDPGVAYNFATNGLSADLLESYLQAGLEPATAFGFHLRGIHPDVVNAFLQAGSVPAVGLPRAVTQIRDQPIDPVVVLGFSEAGLSPGMLASYLGRGCTVAQALGMRSVDLDPSTLEDYDDALEEHVEDVPTVALGYHLADCSPEDIGTLLDHGLDLAAVHGLHDAGVDPSDVDYYESHGLEPTAAYGFGAVGLDVSSLDRFLEAGFGPEEAYRHALADLGPNVARLDHEGEFLAGLDPEDDAVQALDPSGEHFEASPARVTDPALRTVIADLGFERFSPDPTKRFEQIRSRAWGRLVDQIGERRAGYVVHELGPVGPEDAGVELGDEWNPPDGGWPERLTDHLLTPPEVGDDSPPPLRFPTPARRPSAWSKQSRADLLPDRWAVVLEWEPGPDPIESITDPASAGSGLFQSGSAGFQADALAGETASEGDTGDGENEDTKRVVVYGEPIPDPLPLGPPIDDLEAAVEDGIDPDEWVFDFETAIAVGMGVSIDLSALEGWSPRRGFERVFVVGVKASMDPADTAEALEGLLEAKDATDGVSLLEVGTETNVDSSEPTGALDEAQTRVQPPQLTGEADRDVEFLTDGDLLAKSLGLDTVDRHPFAYLPGADATGQLDARHAHSALWPATLGYTMMHLLVPNELAGPANARLQDDNLPNNDDGEYLDWNYGDLGLGDDLLWHLSMHDAYRDHFVRYVRGRGPLPPIRVGDQPYGVLPVKATDDPVTAIPVLEPSIEAGLIEGELTVPEVKAQGVSTMALVESDVSTPDLLAAEADPTELYEHGVDAPELVQGGVGADVLRELGESPEELIEKGVELPAIVEAGFEVVELEAVGATIREVIDAGASAQQLARAGLTVAEIAGYDIPAEELIQAGFAARRLVDAGFTVSDVLRGGAPPSELRDVGFDRETLEKLEVPAGILQQAGVPAQEVLQAGYTVEELVNGGYREQDLGDTGFTLGDVEDAARDVAELVEEADVSELREMGFSPDDLLAANVDLGELFDSGYTTGQLIDAGASVAELIDVEASVGALRAAGVPVDDLLDAGVPITELRESGVSAEVLADVGLDPETLFEEGYTEAELETAGMELAHLAVDEADVEERIDEALDVSITHERKRIEDVERERYDFGFDPAASPALSPAPSGSPDSTTASEKLLAMSATHRTDHDEDADGADEAHDEAREEKHERAKKAEQERAHDEARKEKHERAKKTEQEQAHDEARKEKHERAKKAEQEQAHDEARKEKHEQQDSSTVEPQSFDHDAITDADVDRTDLADDSPAESVDPSEFQADTARLHDVDASRFRDVGVHEGVVDQTLGDVVVGEQSVADAIDLDQEVVFHDIELPIDPVSTNLEDIVTGLRPYWEAAAETLPFSHTATDYGEYSVLDALNHEAIARGAILDTSLVQRGTIRNQDYPSLPTTDPRNDVSTLLADLGASEYRPRLSYMELAEWRDEVKSSELLSASFEDDDIGAYIDYLLRSNNGIHWHASIRERQALLATPPPSLNLQLDIEALANFVVELTPEGELVNTSLMDTLLEEHGTPPWSLEEVWPHVPVPYQQRLLEAALESYADAVDRTGLLDLVEELRDEENPNAHEDYWNALETAARNARRLGDPMLPRSITRVLLQHAVFSELVTGRLRLGLEYDDHLERGPDFNHYNREFPEPDVPNSASGARNLYGVSWADELERTIPETLHADLEDMALYGPLDWAGDGDGATTDGGWGIGGSTIGEDWSGTVSDPVTYSLPTPETYEEALGAAMRSSPSTTAIEPRVSEFADSLRHLMTCDPDEVATLTAEVLDCCSYRLDAWWTSLATKRLYELRETQSVTDEGPPGLYVGAYGYVENLTPRGYDSTPEYVHAPSLQQAASAAFLRGGYLAGEDDDFEGASDLDDSLEESGTIEGEAGENPLSIDLSAERVQDAKWLLDAVSRGISLSELLGYEFERRMHEETLESLAEEVEDELGTGDSAEGTDLLGLRRALREAFPGVEGSLEYVQSFGVEEGEGEAEEGPAVGTEHAQSDVLDGYLLVKRWVDPGAGKSDFEDLFADLDADDYDDENVPEYESAEHEALTGIVDELREDLDAVSDLLVAEGVHHLGTRNVDRASAALDALASGSRFHDPSVTAVDADERGVAHRLFVLLDPRTVEAEDVDTATLSPSFATGDPAESIPSSFPSHLATAEPTLDAWARSLLPAPAEIGFTARYVSVGDDPGAGEIETDERTLETVDLTAIDLVSLATDTEAGAGTEIDAHLAYRLLRDRPAALSDMDPDTLEVEVLASESGDAPVSLAAAIEAAASLGKLFDESRPADGRDLGHPATVLPTGHTTEVDDTHAVSGGHEVDDLEVGDTVAELEERAERIHSRLEAIDDELESWLDGRGEEPVTERVDEVAAAAGEVESVVSPLATAIETIESADLAAEIGSLADAIAPGETDPAAVSERIVVESAPDQSIEGTIGRFEQRPSKASLADAGVAWAVDTDLDDGTVTSESTDDQPTTVDVTVWASTGASALHRAVTDVPVEAGDFEATVDLSDVPVGTRLSVVATDGDDVVFADTGRVCDPDAPDPDEVLQGADGLRALRWLVATAEAYALARGGPLASLANGLDAIDRGDLLDELGPFADSDGSVTTAGVADTVFDDADAAVVDALLDLVELDAADVESTVAAPVAVATAMGLTLAAEIRDVDAGPLSATIHRLERDVPGVASVAVDDELAPVAVDREQVAHRLRRVASASHRLDDLAADLSSVELLDAAEDVPSVASTFDPTAVAAIDEADDPALAALGVDLLARAPAWLVGELDGELDDPHERLARLTRWAYAASDLDAGALESVADDLALLADSDPVTSIATATLGEVLGPAVLDAVSTVGDPSAIPESSTATEDVADLIDDHLADGEGLSSDLDVDSRGTLVTTLTDRLAAVDGEAAARSYRRAVLERVREPLLAAAHAGVSGATPRVPVAASPFDEDTLASQAEAVRRRIADRLEASLSHAPEGGLRYETIDRRVDAAVSRLEALTDEAVPILPPFTPPNPTELSAAFSHFADDTAETETWLQREARVRKRPARVSEALSYAEALTGDWHRELRPAQLPFDLNDPPEAWVGADGVEPDRNQVSLVAQFGEGALDPGPELGWVAGLAVDSWVETVHEETTTTGLAIQFDDPGNEPPQSVLLATPKDGEAWSLESLVGAVSETMCYARYRSVDPADLGVVDPPLVDGEVAVPVDGEAHPSLVGSLLPAVYIPQRFEDSGYGPTVTAGGSGEYNFFADLSGLRYHAKAGRDFVVEYGGEEE